MVRVERASLLVLVLALGLLVVLDTGATGAGGSWESIITISVTGAVAALAWAGTAWLVEGTGARPRRRPDVVLPSPARTLEGLLPALLAAASVPFLRVFDPGLPQIVVLLLSVGAFSASVWAAPHAAGRTNGQLALAQTVLDVLDHVVAFMLFCVIYGLKTRALVSAPLAGAAASVLMYEMLSRAAMWSASAGVPRRVSGRWIVMTSLGVGLVAGEFTWGLNYWAALPTLVGGAALLVLFYVLQGLLSHLAERRLTRQIVVEFGAVGTLGASAVLLFAYFS